MQLSFIRFWFKNKPVETFAEGFLSCQTCQDLRVHLYLLTRGWMEMYFGLTVNFFESMKVYLKGTDENMKLCWTQNM